MSYVFIDEEMWERLAKALRWFEAHGLDQPPPVTVTAPSGPLPPNLYEVTAVDTEAGTCTVQVVENATGDLLGEVGQIEDVEYPTSAEPSVGDQGTLTRIVSGAVMFYEGGGASNLFPALITGVEDGGQYPFEEATSTAGVWSALVGGRTGSAYTNGVEFATPTGQDVMVLSINDEYVIMPQWAKLEEA